LKTIVIDEHKNSKMVLYCDGCEAKYQVIALQARLWEPFRSTSAMTWLGIRLNFHGQQTQWRNTAHRVIFVRRAPVERTTDDWVAFFN